MLDASRYYLFTELMTSKKHKNARMDGTHSFIPRRSASPMDDYYELSRRRTALLFAVELLHLHGIVGVPATASAGTAASSSASLPR